MIYGRNNGAAGKQNNVNDSTQIVNEFPMKKHVLLHSFFFFLLPSFFFFLSSFVSAQPHSCVERKALIRGKSSSAGISSTGISDTIHVKHYSIAIDTINYTSKTIRANAKLIIQSKQNALNNISLWLLKLQVDSVKSGTQALNFSYNDTLLRISPGTALNTGDTVEITVYYQGLPQMDPSGWGGFYFNGNYAFNLGVGFDADPHTFGRAWFPCVDEFTDRALYDFFITTPFSYKAFCNGTLQSETDNGNNTKTWHWKMNQPIPTYLASVAVAPFYTMFRNYSGIPVEFGILPGDSNATINTYANLDTCVSAFINAWGSYPFDKIGYVMTPVTYGGMEHASSIHLSKVFVNGTKTYETLWAHELSHMWWGDKVTCDKQEEMWLNEGWATFNEHLFTEAVYGKEAYKNSFRKDHREVLQFAHIEDGNYWAMNNLPHAYTYAGLSVYTKGALVAHTLRNYMGDEKFFAGCKNYMNSFAYGNANSSDLRDALAASSGMDMNDFFEGWVFTPGFPQFSIDSSRVIPNGNSFDVNLFTRQKQKGNSHLYKMNVEINFTDGLNDTAIVFLMDDYTNNFLVNLPFDPLWIAVDRNEKMMDATTDYERTISSAGTNQFPETNVSLNVLDTGAGKSIVRIEHHWVAPDFFKDTSALIRLSDYHYWKTDGIFASGFHSKATFTYDGSASGTTGYIDNTLITGNEDSLLILYREGAWDDWKIVNGYTHNKGAASDKKGNFVADTLKKGEYALGKYDYTVAGQQSAINHQKSAISIYPNPVTDICRIEFSVSLEKSALAVSDSKGTVIYSTPVFSHQQFINWDTGLVPAGMYYVSIFAGEKIVNSERMIVVK